eukprot:g3360.t1
MVFLLASLSLYCAAAALAVLRYRRGQQSQKKAATPIPIIDLSQYSGPAATAESKRRCAEAWHQAFSTVGFAVLTNHGVPHLQVARLDQLARDFFEQDPAEKGKCSTPGYGGTGYTPPGVEAVGRSRAVDGHEEVATVAADPVESFVFTNGGHPPDMQPADPPGLLAAVRDYVFSMEELLAKQVLPLSATALGLPCLFFDNFYGRPGGRTGANALRLAYYPPVDTACEGAQSADGKGSGGNSGTQSRYGAHTDYQGFTLLRADPLVGGLQVYFPDGKWVAIPPLGDTVEDAIIVNSGDLIKLWTNDTWTSALHRVVAPSSAAAGKGAASGQQAAAPARLSLVFFTGPRDDAQVAPLDMNGPPRYKPVLALDHLKAKLAKSNV